MEEVKRLIFDADDTLWDNNVFYENATQEFFELWVTAGGDRKQIEKEFNQTESAVVREKGYGSSSFLYIIQSLYESHPELKENIKIIRDYNKIIKSFKKHLEGQIAIFPEVIPTLKKLSNKYELYILTKGNLAEQKQKLRKSKLLTYFNDSFVVHEKNLRTYENILKNKKWHAEEVCMIGNSPKSDINPALRMGMYAVFIPYPYTWKLESESLLKNHSHLYVVSKFSDLIPLFGMIDK
jgi:putative hydrolase of the HAD superfamily